ncbi:MAG TPA: hypothetical protein VNJ09_07835 [Chthonomonadales bacterium]|nr:hypothetical protein [Chthonomonadales bacterium]
MDAAEYKHVVLGLIFLKYISDACNVDLDVFVVMPNHVHGIIVLTNVGAGFEPAPTRRPGVVQALARYNGGGFLSGSVNLHPGLTTTPLPVGKGKG